ncbi:MAG: YbjN domain-containing protein [Micrococcales bacterium]|nr:YbjN domain-containing protein [Micrococcales bacterium]
MTDPTSLPNFPPPADEHPLRGRVLDALIDQGMQPNVDADGDVAIQIDDQQLFVRCTEGDFPIMRVFGQWALAPEIPADPQKQLETCNEINLTLNLIKTGLANNTLVVTGEHLVGDDSDLASLLQITIQIVLAGVQMWHERILGLEPGGLGQPGGPEGTPGGDLS